jgi:hypothetical protein
VTLAVFAEAVGMRIGLSSIYFKNRLLQISAGASMPPVGAADLWPDDHGQSLKYMTTGSYVYISSTLVDCRANNL